jgi:hypothetical protein
VPVPRLGSIDHRRNQINQPHSAQQRRGISASTARPGSPRPVAGALRGGGTARDILALSRAPLRTFARRVTLGSGPLPLRTPTRRPLWTSPQAALTLAHPARTPPGRPRRLLRAPQGRLRPSSRAPRAPLGRSRLPPRGAGPPARPPSRASGAPRRVPQAAPPAWPKAGRPPRRGGAERGPTDRRPKTEKRDGRKITRSKKSVGAIAARRKK